MRRSYWMLLVGCAVLLIGATDQPIQLYRIPVRPVRQMLSAQGLPAPVHAAVIAPILDPLQPLPKLAVRRIIVGISRPLVMDQMPALPTADIILEPLTNGCFSVVVTNADPTYVWLVQTSTDLLVWTGAQSLSNATSYNWIQCFPTNVDNLFFRLEDP